MDRTIHIARDGDIETEPDSWAETVSQHRDARLLRVTDGESEGDWIFYPSEDRYGWAMEFQNETDARLMWGLWLETGGFSTPESATQHIPVEVVRQGKDACAAYLTVGTGAGKMPRSAVADALAISEQTVSNYCNRIRWSE